MKKKLIALMMMALPLMSIAQSQELNGVGGVMFGLPADSIKYIMRDKHSDAAFNEIKGNNTYYVGGKFAGKNVLLWIFQSTKTTGVHTIIIVLNNESYETYNSFDDMTDMMDSKYGVHSHREDYQWPYTADDKYKFGESMFKSGKATLENIWEFKGSGYDGRSNKNYIAVEVNNQFSVAITYQDGSRIDKASDMKKNANMSDL